LINIVPASHAETYGQVHIDALLSSLSGQDPPAGGVGGSGIIGRADKESRRWIEDGDSDKQKNRQFF
jgi:hypothetical protein